MNSAEVKQQPNKDGSGKGQMAAWKVHHPPSLPSRHQPLTNSTIKTQAAKIGKEYETRGGDYENTPGSKDKPKKEPPEKKPGASREEEKKAQKKDAERDPDETEDAGDDGDDGGVEKEEEKLKGNERRKATSRLKGGEKKERKVPANGTRSSARQAEARVGRGRGRV
jgi:hypothetical protein